MKENPHVSVILPTYNRVNILPVCIDAVMEQTYKNIDLIILNDGSTDDTKELIESYAKHYGNIKAFTFDHNISHPRTKNTGVSQAHDADLIFIIEDDLVLEDTCIQVMVDTFFEKTKEDGKYPVIVPRLIEELHVSTRIAPIEKAIMSHVPAYVDPLTGELFNNYGKDFGEVIRVPMGHACCLYPKQYMVTFGGYAEGAYTGNYCREESDLNMRMIHSGINFYFQPAAITHHNRINSGGCRVKSTVSGTYYFVRNHIVFIIRNFGLKSAYMVPCFLAAFGTRTILRKAKKVT
jgi:glycosyltransferase involved in cell wall biosynthesis